MQFELAKEETNETTECWRKPPTKLNLQLGLASNLTETKLKLNVGQARDLTVTKVKLKIGKSPTEKKTIVCLNETAVWTNLFLEYNC